MAKQCMIRREKKRIKLASKYQEQRKELTQQLKDPQIPVKEKFLILEKLEKMPVDSSMTRQSRRCNLTGRSRGVWRKFGICRNEMRRLAMLGQLPGVVFSSW